MDSGLLRPRAARGYAWWSPPSIGLDWFALLAISTVFFAARVGHEPLWLDESYSFAMTQHGFFDIVRLTAGDVHPPLYYLVLKLSTLLFGASPAALRVPSVLAAVGLLALGAGPVRRIWGDLTGYVYALLAAISPGVLCFAQEARMYTLVAFVVTGAVLYGHLALIEQRKSDLVWFGLFTWSAAMTHYFGLVAAGMNCLLLLATARVKYRDRLKPFVLTLLLAGGLYSPWLIPFWAQLKAVTHGFWIPPTSLKLLVFALVAPFAYKFEDIPYPWQAVAALGLVALVIVSSLIVKSWRGPSRAVQAQLHLLAVYLLTLGFGWAFSRLVQPVLMPRYMMSCAGLLLLLTAAGLSKLPSLRSVVLGVALFIGLSLHAWLRIQTATFNGPFAVLAGQIRDAGDPDPVLLHTDGQTLYPSWHAVPQGRHIMFTEKGDQFDPSGGGVYETRRLTSNDDLGTILNGTNRVWVVDMDPTPHHIAPASILEHPGWQQRGPAIVLDLPMSWVKVKLFRYEFQAPR